MKKYYSKEAMSLDALDIYLEKMATKGWQLIQILDFMAPVKQQSLNIHQPNNQTIAIKVFVPVFEMEVEDEKAILN